MGFTTDFSSGRPGRPREKNKRQHDYMRGDEGCGGKEQTAERHRGILSDWRRLPTGMHQRPAWIEHGCGPLGSLAACQRVSSANVMMLSFRSGSRTSLKAPEPGGVAVTPTPRSASHAVDEPFGDFRHRAFVEWSSEQTLVPGD
jgi:hypothetical protein